MSRNKFAYLLLIFITLAHAPFSVFATNSNVLRIGSVAMDTPAVMHKRLLPLTKHLSSVLNREVKLKLSPDMSSAINDVVKGKVDIAYLTPVAYLKSHDKGNTQLVVKTVTNNKASFQLMIAVAEKSPIKSVQELSGKRFAFGDRAALLQRATVVGANMPLDKLGKYSFLGHYDNIARSILHGDYDAGILKDTKAFKWQGKGLRIIYESPHLPPYNLTARANLDQGTLKKIRSALLGLDVNNNSHRKIIKSLSKKYTGFAETSDAEYDVVRQLIKPFTQ